ncbi:hypothetical protein [Ideonella sp.]|uniref:hypothetical protein n=1 Tax=Ideonella sp. TaxID=1929293 RepID=UPI0035B0FA66
MQKTASAHDTAQAVADRLAERADHARERMHAAVDTLHHGADDLLHAAPNAFSRAAAQMEAITRRGVDRAREAGHRVSDSAHLARDRTLGYVAHEPVKSLLIAVAAGAAVALLAGWLSRSRQHPPY